MELIQIFTTLAIIFCVTGTNGQNLGRTVTTKVDGCNKDAGAQSGDTVTIHYTGNLKSNGKKFDSSIGGEPIKFRLGQGRVIKGWEDGLLGTCEGESLRLDIPSSLGYGDQGMSSIKYRQENINAVICLMIKLKFILFFIPIFQRLGMV